MVYDDLCLMTGNGSSSKDNSSDPTIVALLAVEGTGMTLGALLLAVTVVHLLLTSDLKDKFIQIQIHICSSIFISQIFLGFGFLVTPCQALEIHNQETFKIVCKFLSTVQLVCILSSFNWKWIEAGYICHLVAVKCNAEFERSKKKPKESKRVSKNNDSQNKNLYRTFSKDITFDRSTLKNEPSLKKTVEKAKQSEQQVTVVEETIRKAWYIKFFSKDSPSVISLLLLGYIPPVILTAISFSSTPADKSSKSNIGSLDLDDYMTSIGLDIYCWPGSKSNMILYMIGGVILLTILTLYFRFKAVQMVRLIRSGILGQGPYEVKMVNSVIKWQRQNSGLERLVQQDDFYIRSSMIIMFVMLCTWVFGTLQSVLVWGLAVPFGTLCFLQGFIYFLFHVAKKYSSIFITR